MVIVITGFALAYAVVRYHVFAGVPWSELPLFVSNKGLALASVLLFALAYLASRQVPDDAGARMARRRLARRSGLAGFWLMIAHVAISLGILGARRYPVLVDAAGLTTAGVVCLVMGACGTLVFAVPALTSSPRVSMRLSRGGWRRSQQLGYVALALTGAHVLAVGMHNFLAVERWPGGLPPITLLSFVACLVPIAAKLAATARRLRRSRDSAPSLVPGRNGGGMQEHRP